VKTVTVRDLQKRVKQCVDDAQRDHVVITRHGKPAAVLVGVEGADWDTLALQSTPGPVAAHPNSTKTANRVAC
jgi:prevent-host-death family protein